MKLLIFNFLMFLYFIYRILNIKIKNSNIIAKRIFQKRQKLFLMSKRQIFPTF